MDPELRKFDEIRPFEPEELPAVYDRLVADPQFRSVVSTVYPDVPFSVLEQKMRSCHSSMEFQLQFCKPFMLGLMAKASSGYEMDYSAISPQQRYTFVSNHRDIVLDSAILDLLLVVNGFPTTCEIAIGDNLLKMPWIKDLVRLNKSFIVERDLPMRQLLLASKRLAEYMHYSIGRKHENIWIAQREGRAKDSDDRTQESILKMMAMGGDGTPAQRLESLHIVPLAISYEFDPCDYLKAKEFQQRRDNPQFHKGPTDDLVSMRTGIFGYKGHVHYHCAPCIDDFIANASASLSKNAIYPVVAEEIDRRIHFNYRLYPNNYIAADEKLGGRDFSSNYTDEDVSAFNAYVEGQVAKVDLPNKDEAFLRERIITMYANPAINKMKALEAINK